MAGFRKDNPGAKLQRQNHLKLVVDQPVDRIQHLSPTILLPYQCEALRRSAASRLFVCEKSRRTGMTWAFAADAVMTASQPDGMDIFYLAYNFEMTREFMANCVEFASELVAKSGGRFGQNTRLRWIVTRNRIHFPQGFTITALPSSPRSLRGKQGKVIIDEAAFHDDLTGVLKAALALTMWGGRVVVISTHDGVDNVFATLIDEIRAGRRPGNVMRLTLEDALDQGLYKRICRKSGRRWSLSAQSQWEAELRNTYGENGTEELDVVPSRSGAAWLSRATIEAAMTGDYPVLRLIPPLDFTTLDRDERAAWIEAWIEGELAPLIDRFDPDQDSFFGQDFARSSDLSVIAAGQFDAQAILQCRIVIEMRGVPFREQKQLLDALCTRMPRFVAGKMDARGNGQQLAEEMGDDFGQKRIDGVMATARTYLAMMPRLKARIEDRTIAIPRSEGIVSDLRLIRLVAGVPQIVDRVDDRADGAKGRRHGDTAVALMHLVAAADTDVVEIAFETLGQRDSVRDTRFTHSFAHNHDAW